MMEFFLCLLLYSGTKKFVDAYHPPNTGEYNLFDSVSQVNSNVICKDILQMKYSLDKTTNKFMLNVTPYLVLD